MPGRGLLSDVARQTLFALERRAGDQCVGQRYREQGAAAAERNPATVGLGPGLNAARAV